MASSVLGPLSHKTVCLCVISVMLAMLPMFTAEITTTSPDMNGAGACNQQQNCSSCVSTNIAFNCSWCSAINKCSDGFDQFRQIWVENKCNATENHIDEVTKCFDHSSPAPTEAPPQTAKPVTAKSATTPDSLKPSTDPAVDFCKDVHCQHGGVCEQGLCNCPPQFEGSRCQKYVTGHCQGIVCENGGTCRQGITTHICDCLVGFSGRYCDAVISPNTHPKGAGNTGLTVGAIVCIVLITLLVLGLFVWAVYAYRHPSSSSGLFVLEAKHRLKGRGRGSNGVKYKYHQQVDGNQIDIQF